MTQPAKRTHKQMIGKAIKGQLWVLFLLIVTIAIIDSFWLDRQLVVAKSMALGALLSFLTQAVFAAFVFRHSGYRARRHIVGQLYRGQMVKWLLTAIGFALIFITIRPLSAPALLIGFMVMQVSHSWMLWHLR